MARKSFALQLETVFVDPLDSLARTDLPATREHRKRWEKAGSEYLHENSKFMARKPKDAALADGAAEVAILRKEYHEVSLEYVSRLVEVLGKEQVRINEAVLALCQSRIALCEKEQAVFEDVGPNLHLLERAAAVVGIEPKSALTNLVGPYSHEFQSDGACSTASSNPRAVRTSIQPVKNAQRFDHGTNDNHG